MNLREFLFLNEDSVDNYLSQLQGYITEEIAQTDSENREGGVEASISVVKGKGGVNHTRQTNYKKKITPEARFQLLYDTLGEAIQFIDAFDEVIWNQIERNEILEIQANLRLPLFFTIDKAIEVYSSWLDFGENITRNLNPNLSVKQKEELKRNESVKNVINQVNNLLEMFKDKPIPLICESASTPGYTFMADLPRNWLRNNIQELQGEATILGKVMRIIPLGENTVGFSFIDELNSLANIGQVDKSKFDEAQNQLSKSGLAEIVAGPAIKIAPIAIYR